MTSGGLVDLVVSLGPELVEVPELVGLTEVEAAAVLASLGYVVDFIIPANSSSPAGQVILQSPTGGSRVLDDTESALVISLGAPEAGAVPAGTELPASRP